jgi:hypothetical protein
MKAPLTLTLMAAAAAVTAGTAIAEGYGFEIHITQADYSACDGVDDTALDCDSINPDGQVDLGTQQFAWIVAWGWENSEIWPDPPNDKLGGALFAVRYPKDVLVSGWNLCTGGAGIPVDNGVDGTWPQSDTGLAVTWAGGAYDSPSGFAKVGFLVIEDGSFGLLEIVDHVQAETIQLASGPMTPVEITVGPEGRGVADVDGTLGGSVKVCDKVPTRSTTWSAIKSMY